MIKTELSAGDFTYFTVEVAGGLLTSSLALFAMWITQRPANPAKTYGYYRREKNE